jgi:mRNA interferase YafQ
MYKLQFGVKYKKSYDKCELRKYDMSKLDKAVSMLQAGTQLPREYKDHPLKGTYKGCRECHLGFDWVLIYRYEKDKLILILVNTGTHDDLKI